VRVQPEYESLKRLAEAAGVSLLEAERVAAEAAARVAAERQAVPAPFSGPSGASGG
jgi:hypothetical protein